MLLSKKKKEEKKYLLGRIVEILWESMCHPPNTIFPLCQPIRSHPRSDTTRGSRTCNIHLSTKSNVISRDEYVKCARYLNIELRKERNRKFLSFSRGINFLNIQI